MRLRSAIADLRRQARNPYSRSWLWIPGSLVSLAPRNDGSIHIPQHRLDRPALVRRECGLRRYGIADLVALDREARLDARREVITRERFVDAPQFALQLQRIVPARGLAEIV